MSRVRVADDWPVDEPIAKDAYAARTIVTVSDHWAEWLGSLVVDEMREGGLTLYVTAPSKTPKILDAENEALTTRCNDLLHSLLIQGVPPFQRMLMMTGANVDGEIQVRQYAGGRELKTTYGLEDFVPGRPHADRAGRVSDRLRKMQDATNGNWGRLLRATRVLLDTNRTDNTHGERFHQFVRVLDGLVKTRPGRGATDFAHRVQNAFALANPETSETLLEMYDFRSAVEHLNSILEAVDVPTDIVDDIPRAHEYRVDRVNRLTRQLDVLVRSVITTILDRAELFDETFRTDDSIDAFWRLGDRERIAAWGSRLDIRAVR